MSISMTKYPATLAHGVRFIAMISISQMFSSSKENPRPDYSLWEKMYWNRALPTQAVNGPIRMGSGRHEAICIEAVDPKGAGLQSASCFMLDGSWKADFLGDADDMRTFLDTVRRFD